MIDRQIKWDFRFLDLAEFIAAWSKDESTKTGAVIVRPNLSVASLGFNGFPQGMPDNQDIYSKLALREEKYSRIVHCEVNAMIFAREPLNGYTLYTWPYMSCDRCVVQMIQAGITRFVYPKAPASTLDRWGAIFEKVRMYMEECGVEYKEYD